MTDIEKARRHAIAQYREQHRPHRKPTPFEQVLLNVGCRTFAEGFDAAVKAQQECEDMRQIAMPFSKV
jgi:hypothetical protein